MSIFVETMKVNYTKKSGSAMTGDQVGAVNFATWKTAVENCRKEFYKYECEKHRIATKGENATVDATGAFNALQAIIDLVGEVNGHKVVKNQAMLDVLSVCTLSKVKPLVGEAETIYSRIKNFKSQLEDVHTGMNPEYVASLEKGLAEAEEEFKIAKTQTGSCAPMTTCVKPNTFRTKFEEEFCKTVINEQEAKSWEELEAEAEARRQERNAKAKARKANKKAKAKTEAAA